MSIIDCLQKSRTGDKVYESGFRDRIVDICMYKGSERPTRFQSFTLFIDSLISGISNLSCFCC